MEATLKEILGGFSSWAQWLAGLSTALLAALALLHRHYVVSKMGKWFTGVGAVLLCLSLMGSVAMVGALPYIPGKLMKDSPRWWSPDTAKDLRVWGAERLPKDPGEVSLIGSHGVTLTQLGWAVQLFWVAGAACGVVACLTTLVNGGLREKKE